MQLIFKKTSEKFIKPLSYYNKAYRIKSKQTDNDDGDDGEEDGEEATDNVRPPSAGTNAKGGDLDLLDLAVGDSPTEDHPHPDLPEPLSLDNLEEHFDFDDEKFQEKWSEMSHE